MAVISRPELGAKPPETTEEPYGPPEPMNMRLANALSSGTTMSRVQLETARRFYEQLQAMCLAAGPEFSPMRRFALLRYRMTIDRINGIIDRNEARRREREREEERLLPIEE